MEYYFAPMEGITDYIYRRIHHIFWGDSICKYYTPFITTYESGKYMPRDIKGVLPENNEGITLVPQILTNQAEQFIKTATDLYGMGYREVNLNLGCPSGTVATKGRGSGFLAHMDELEAFLERIFMKLDMKISVKTRIGTKSPDEFYRLLELYNRYPIAELIVHPRIQKEFYTGTPHIEIYRDALAMSKNPLVYNGDLFTIRHIGAFQTQFPDEKTVMIGRGLILNPALAQMERKGVQPDFETLFAFHEQLFEAYRKELSGDSNILHRMKELWFYMIHLFDYTENDAKRLKKAATCLEYHAAVMNLFRNAKHNQKIIGV